MRMHAIRALLLALASLGLSVSYNAPAQAQSARAVVTTDLNMRQGPGTKYRVILTIPGGATVPVYRCTRGYSWCEVSYRGRRGWAYSRYLRDVRERYDDRPLSELGARLGIELFDFVIGQIEDEEDGRDRPRRRPAPGEVCFYEHFNYGGDRFCARVGQADRRLSGNWNDRISSIRVGRGAAARVCQHFDYGGRCETYNSNVSQLTGNRNDQISSYRVGPRGFGGNGGDGRERAEVCFYEHFDFGGASFCARPGASDGSLGSTWNDRISSIRVRGGARTQVCQHFGFDGWCDTYSSDVSRLTGDRNDAVSSYRVR